MKRRGKQNPIEEYGMKSDKLEDKQSKEKGMKQIFCKYKTIWINI